MHKSAVPVAGIPIQATTIEAAVAEILSLAQSKTGVPIRFVNAYSVALGNRDTAYGDVLRGPGINYPDGWPVAWAAQQLGGVTAEQVRGPLTFELTMEASLPLKLRHYFYGTTPETLALLRTALQERYPGLVIAGESSPDFAPAEVLASAENLAPIREAVPDLVWVGLGTPKQDFVAARLAEELGIPVLGVGAAFDFSAGTLREAPEVWKRARMEWAHRLVSEPRRLWRRYLFGNAAYIQLVSKDLMTKRRNRNTQES